MQHAIKCAPCSLTKVHFSWSRLTSTGRCLINYLAIADMLQCSCSSTLERLHIEHDLRLVSLPLWLANATRLTHVHIEHTSLTSLTPLGRAPTLIFAYLRYNRIGSLHTTSFESGTLQVLDLSNNQASQYIQLNKNKLFRSPALRRTPLNVCQNFAFLIYLTIQSSVYRCDRLSQTVN